MEQQQMDGGYRWAVNRFLIEIRFLRENNRDFISVQNLKEGFVAPLHRRKQYIIGYVENGACVVVEL